MATPTPDIPTGTPAWDLVPGDKQQQILDAAVSKNLVESGTPMELTLGGEASDQATLDRLTAAFPDARITHIYASTEAGVVFAVHDGREGFPADWLERPSQGAELRLQDGFLQIRTPNAMSGYVSDTGQPLLDDGWLSTADRCEVRGDRAVSLHTFSTRSGAVSFRCSLYAPSAT